MDPVTRGDPMSPLRWTCKSTRTLAQALTGAGHPVSDFVVRRLLRQLGYSLQANAKVGARAAASTRTGMPSSPYPNDQAAAYCCRATPGDQRGRQEEGEHRRVQERRPRNGSPKGRTRKPATCTTSSNKELGKATPQADLRDVRRPKPAGASAAPTTTPPRSPPDDHRPLVAGRRPARLTRSRGRAADLRPTAAGPQRLPATRLWNTGARRPSPPSTGLAITVCHLPPGTSKWNKIEHRLFSHITQTGAADQSRGRRPELLPIQLPAPASLSRLNSTRPPKGIKIPDRSNKDLANAGTPTPPVPRRVELHAHTPA